MCLTEPHCGTDLGLLKTRAEPRADGSYTISGTKIFITAGEHDFTDNIVHLVLARLPDAPAGSKGISLFIVPKLRVDRDGNVGERNARALRRDRAQDGHPRLGDLRDELRRRPGLADRRAEQGPRGDVHDDEYRAPRRRPAGAGAGRPRLPERAALCARAPADALAVRREIPRQAGRSDHRPSRRAPHAADAEGAHRRRSRCSATTPRRWSTSSATAATTDERKQADALLGFLTPIVKACLTEWGVECTYHALQCFGGHGYIAEHGMEQLARDARITTLYEGTTGIQALDLMGRKIMQLQGAGLRDVPRHDRGVLRSSTRAMRRSRNSSRRCARRRPSGSS